MNCLHNSIYSFLKVPYVLYFSTIHNIFYVTPQEKSVNFIAGKQGAQAFGPSFPIERCKYKHVVQTFLQRLRNQLFYLFKSSLKSKKKYWQKI